MKKTLITTCTLLLFTIISFGQDLGFEHRDKFISGSFNFFNPEGDDNNQLGTNIRLGSFISEKNALGIRVNYTDQEEAKTKSFGIGAFLRNYFSAEEKFSFFLEYGANYAQSENTNFKVNGYNINIIPGISYFLNENFALEASLGGIRYSSFKADFDGAERFNAFESSINLEDLNLGLIYRF